MVNKSIHIKTQIIHFQSIHKLSKFQILDK